MNIPLRQFWPFLIKYLGPLWPRALLVGVLLFIGIGLQLLNPQLLRYFIDTAQTGGRLETLYYAALTFIGVGLLGQVIAPLTTYVADDVGWRTTNRLRSDLMDHVLRLDMSFHNAHSPGELLERIDGDVTRLAGFFSQFVLRLAGSFLLLCGVLLALLFEDWRLSLALGTFSAFYLLTHARAQRIAVPFWRRERQATADLLGFVGERMSGTKDVRTSGAGPYVMRRFSEVMRRWFRAIVSAEIITDLGWAISGIAFGLAYASTMALGLYLFTMGSITIGTVFLVIYYLQILHAPLNTIAREIEALQRFSVSVERVEGLFSTRPQIQDAPGVPVPGGPLAVEFRDVSFGYGQETQALNNLTFRLETGKVMGLLGRTGSGKTSLSRLLFRFYDASRGAIRLSGVDVRDFALSELRQRVGVVTQEVQLFKATVRENLTLFDASIDDERILESLHALGLETWYRSLPEGLDSELAPGGAGLSAGEAQLLAFTRVFLKDPGLVILDEASSRLDSASEHLLDQAMDRLLKDRTGMIIAHRISTVKRVDEIVILEGGSIEEQGPYGQLATDPESRLYQLLRAGLEEMLA